MCKYRSLAWQERKTPQNALRIRHRWKSDKHFRRSHGWFKFWWCYIPVEMTAGGASCADSWARVPRSNNALFYRLRRIRRRDDDEFTLRRLRILKMDNSRRKLVKFYVTW